MEYRRSDIEMGVWRLRETEGTEGRSGEGRRGVGHVGEAVNLFEVVYQDSIVTAGGGEEIGRMLQGVGVGGSDCVLNRYLVE